MARSPELEAILEAWFRSEYGAPNDRAEARAALIELLEKAAQKSGNEVTPFQIQSALYDRYKVFKAEKFKSSSVQVAQSALKPNN
ncbi:MAG TPA: hypothetical protein VH280_22420 [Verrucomicrobiae bacterium]|jgi:hypothetical protein|nr:hypothetical protein [Verrucomicrobiae bacterium]